jgi:two-component system, chemotaxis family, protein-glutamate methylesterase/glutaminase
MRKIRVLVVDDSVVIRKLLRTVIDAQQDMEVVGTAANGSIALLKLDQSPPDLITMDLDMPEMDGLETVRSIRARGLRLPIIMVSATTYKVPRKPSTASSAGADDFITKPGNLSDFSECLQVLESDLLPKIRALAHIEPLPVSTFTPGHTGTVRSG